MGVLWEGRRRSLKVTRVQIVARGLRNRCPNCGGKTLFREGTLLQVNSACPQCGLKFEHDEGFFLGSMSINYGATTILWLLPVLLLACFHVIGVTLAIVLAGTGALIFPLLFYRTSRSLWLMNYYIVVPQQLPANRTDGDGDDDNV